MNEPYPDRKYRCLWCGDRTHRPVAAFLEHFRLYESGNWKWFRGNMRTFGWWDGFWATIGLICPLYTTLRHWRRRKATLVLADGKPLESAFDERGCAIPPAQGKSASEGK